MKRTYDSLGDFPLEIALRVNGYMHGVLGDHLAGINKIFRIINKKNKTGIASLDSELRMSKVIYSKVGNKKGFQSKVLQNQVRLRKRSRNIYLLVKIPLPLLMYESQERIPFNQIPLWINKPELGNVERDVLKIRLEKGDLAK